MRFLTQVLVQTFFVLLNLMANHDSVYKMVGWLNRRKRFLKAVFVTYPNTEKIASRIAPRWLWPRLKWQPYFIGIFEQGGHWGLKFVISSLPHEIYTSENKTNRLGLLDRMEYLSRLIGAEKVLFGFALNSALRDDRPRNYQGGLRVTADDAAVAARAAVLAVEKLKAQKGLDDVPIIFLATFSMASRISVNFSRIQGIDYLASSRVYVVNPGQLDKGGSVWPTELFGDEVIIISLVKEDDLLALKDRLGPRWIVINEAYLRDPNQFVRQLSRPDGMSVYQLCGAQGWTTPDPPGIYQGSMPCCQVISPANMEVVVREIKPR